MNRSRILKMTIILAVVTVLCGAAARIIQNNSMSLSEYEALHSTASTAASDEASDSTSGGAHDGLSASASDEASGSTSGEARDGLSASASDEASGSAAGGAHDGLSASASDEASGSVSGGAHDGLSASASALTGAALNGDSVYELRVTYADGFYYEPLSDALKRYMTGVSYPADKVSSQTKEASTPADKVSSQTKEASAPAEAASSNGEPAITLDELRYVHILHYNFDGEPAEGELVCNAAIAQDLIEIFYQLYRNEYQLESVLLIDEFDGDDIASMEANNTSCFNYRVVEGSAKLSRHAYGLAVDINPFYNPYIKYEKDGTETISPAAAAAYTDRSAGFSYKIDENDLCYRLFTQYGFTWGGNWNSVKDYQHFQKTPD